MVDTNTATPATTDTKAVTAPTAPISDRGGEAKPFGPKPTREAALKSGLETMQRLEKERGIVVADAADAIPKQTALPEDGQPRAKDGKFAPKESPAGETPAGKVESKFSEADREKAVTGHRRGKTPEKALAALSEDERVQWGLDLAKSQSEGDRRVTEASKAKTQIADPALKPTGQPAPTGNLRGLSEDLGLDEIGHTKLEAAFTERDTQITALGKEMKAQQADFLEVLLDHAFSELAKDYPELATDEGRKAVFPRAVRLAETGDYDSQYPRPMDRVREVVRDASGIEFREAIAERQAARAKSARRDASQPTPPTPGKQHKPTGRKEWAMMSMALLEQGVSSDETKARLGG